MAGGQRISSRQPPSRAASSASAGSCGATGRPVGERVDEAVAAADRRRTTVPAARNLPVQISASEVRHSRTPLQRSRTSAAPGRGAGPPAPLRGCCRRPRRSPRRTIPTTIRRVRISRCFSGSTASSCFIRAAESDLQRHLLGTRVQREPLRHHIGGLGPVSGRRRDARRRPCAKRCRTRRPGRGVPDPDSAAAPGWRPSKPPEQRRQRTDHCVPRIRCGPGYTGPRSGRMISTTSRSASRLPATASATAASRRSPGMVIDDGYLQRYGCGRFGQAWLQLVTISAEACHRRLAHLPMTAVPRHEVAHSIPDRGDLGRVVRCAADVGQQTGQRPAQAAPDRAASASASAASATRREPARSPALHNAAASTTSLLTRWRRRPGAASAGKLDPTPGVTHGRGAIAAGHRQFGPHPCQPDRQPGRRIVGTGVQPGGAFQQRGRRGEPTHSESVGGQADKRVGAGLRRRCPRGPGPPVPVLGPPRASRAGAGRRRGC